MTRILFAVLFLAGLACAIRAADTSAPPKDAEAEGERPVQLRCPITNALLADVAEPETVVIEGFAFQVRDKEAAKKAEADPKAAFAALEKNEDAAEPVSPVCPVMKGKVKKSQFLQKGGRRIYVCCKGCLKQLEKSWNWDRMLVIVKELAETETPEDLPEM